MLGEGAWLVPKTSVSDGTIRIVFKIYLVALTLAVAALGGYAIKVIVRSRLLKGKSVALPVTTGWVSGGGLGHAVYKLRRLPGGAFGWVMLIFTALNIACDLSVAKAITLIFWPGRDTSSEYGMIVDTHQKFSAYPDTYNGAYLTAFVAQYYADQNWQNVDADSNGYIVNNTADAYGIYRYVPVNNEIFFMPAQQDIIGAWECSVTTPQPIVYSGQQQFGYLNLTAVAEDLMERDILYNTTTVTGPQTYIWDVASSTLTQPNQTVWPMHLVYYTFNTSTPGSVFSYKIAVDTQDFDEITGVKAMTGFECNLQAYDEEQTVYEIAKAINVYNATVNFGSTIGGGLYSGINSGSSFPVEDLGSQLASYLNSMIMVAGSGQNTIIPNTRGYDYGIIMPVTIVPDWVLAICAVFGFSAIILAITTGALWFQSRKLRREYDSSEAGARIPSSHIFDHAPVGLMDWTKYATYRAGNGTLNLANFKERNWVMTTKASRHDVIDIVSKHEDLESSDTATNTSQENVHKTG